MSSTRYVNRPPTDENAWLGSPNKAIPPIQMPAGGGFPVKPRFWKFDYDDAAFWSGTPNKAIPPLQMPVGGGFPFRPSFWKYDYDSPGFWVGAKSNPIFQPDLPGPNIISTLQMQLPVDAVVIGEQEADPGALPLSRLLYRSIFRE